MHMMPILWIVWAGIATILVALLMYRSTLLSNEEDQIHLDANAEHAQQEQDLMFAKARRLNPYVYLTTAITCLMGAGILSYYIWDAIRHLS